MKKKKKKSALVVMMMIITTTMMTLTTIIPMGQILTVLAKRQEKIQEKGKRTN